MPPKAGRVIARRYQLEEAIGQGAMGIVWRAHDRRLHRKVAVKEVRLDPATDGDMQANRYLRTEREAQTAARLSHRNIVTIHDVVMTQGRPWIVMELIPFPSLETILQSPGPLTPLRAALIGQQLLAALTAAHSASVLHRDVKPSNVLIAPERPGDGAGERAVLTDFGIAQFEGDVRLTQTGHLVGTVGFMAPERLDGGDASPASDLWSLGATIYAAVVGRGPFDRATTVGTLSAIMREGLPPAPPAGRLTPLIAGLLRRDPASRLSAMTAARMFAEILPLMIAETVTGRREDTEPSGLPVLIAPAEPLSAPTQTIDAHPRPAPPERAADSLSRPARGPSRRFARKPVIVIAGSLTATAVAAAVLLVASSGLFHQTTGSAAIKPLPPAPSSTSPSSSSGSASPAASRVPDSAKPGMVAALNIASMTTPPGYTFTQYTAGRLGTQAGFQIYIPPGWHAARTKGQPRVDFRGPADARNGAEVVIYLTDGASTPLAQARDLHRQDSRQRPGYQLVSGKGKQFIVPVVIHHAPGVFYQFDWRDNGIQMRVNELLFTESAQSFRIYATGQAGPDDDAWNSGPRVIITAMLQSFGAVS